MTIFTIDPLTDSRWPDLLDRHPDASAFHARGWLGALKQTYGYEPVVYTTTPEGESLENGIVFCRVRSWLTGRRCVSLPFSDHCQPLISDDRELEAILKGAGEDSRGAGAKYVELRPRRPIGSSELRASGFSASEKFAFHALDLSPDLDDLFGAFHSNNVRRKIRKAQKVELKIESGASDDLLDKFYRLLVPTRRRHHLPPQPVAWFRNLAANLGEGMKIWVASKDGRAIASILTLQYKKSLVYKYGCSDLEFSKLGGTVLLFWRAIQQAKADGLVEFDLGRSDLTNSGLLQFKDRWGAERTDLVYYRSPEPGDLQKQEGRVSRLVKRSFALMPDPLLVAAGRALYRHMG